MNSKPRDKESCTLPNEKHILMQTICKSDMAAILE